jgi:predicted DNA-binding transcriptional regulator
MTSKDQTIGAVILIFCLIVAIGYIAVLVSPQIVNQILRTNWDPATIQFWAVAVIVLIAFLAIMFIGAWIGWTMATTPPPKPIEELEKETTEEKPVEKTEATTEAKTETVAPQGETKKRAKKAKEA